MTVVYGVAGLAAVSASTRAARAPALTVGGEETVWRRRGPGWSSDWAQSFCFALSPDCRLNPSLPDQISPSVLPPSAGVWRE